MNTDAQVAIIGGGPSGLSAAINLASDGKNTVLVESTSRLGGQAKHTSALENVLGWPKGISGPELFSAAEQQALKFGTRIVTGAKVEGIVSNGHHALILSDGRTIGAESIVIASGLRWKLHPAVRHDIRGVYYGANPHDAESHVNDDVVIIGGANSASQAALHWANYARRVFVIVRRDLTATTSQYLVTRVNAHPKIAVLTETEVVKCINDGVSLQGLILKNAEQEHVIECGACVVFIGLEPEAEWAGVELDDKGFIVTGVDYSTSRNGIYAIGDIRNGVAKRVSAAIGDGGAVASFVNRYLNSRVGVTK